MAAIAQIDAKPGRCRTLEMGARAGGDDFWLAWLIWLLEGPVHG